MQLHLAAMKQQLDTKGQCTGIRALWADDQIPHTYNAGFAGLQGLQESLIACWIYVADKSARISLVTTS